MCTLLLWMDLKICKYCSMPSKLTKLQKKEREREIGVAIRKFTGVGVVVVTLKFTGVRVGLGVELFKIWLSSPGIYWDQITWHEKHYQMRWIRKAILRLAKLQKISKTDSQITDHIDFSCLLVFLTHATLREMWSIWLVVPDSSVFVSVLHICLCT